MMQLNSTRNNFEGNTTLYDEGIKNPSDLYVKNQKENSEIIEKFETGMAVVYTSKTGDKYFGCLWNLQDEHNFTMLPIDQNCLDRIDNDNGLTYINFKNTRGSLEKAILTAEKVKEWKSWGESRYGADSEAYRYLERNLDRASDLVISKKTSLLACIPEKLDKIVLNEESSEEILAKNKIVKLINYIPKRLKNNPELSKSSYIRGRMLAEGIIKKESELTEKIQSQESNLLPEVDGFKILEKIFYYDELENKIKTGFFICKSELKNHYTIDKGEYTNSQTKKRVVESLPCEYASKNHLDLLRFIRNEQTEPKEKVITTTGIDLDRDKFQQILLDKEENKKKEIENIFENVNFEDNFSIKSEFDKLRRIISNKDDAKLFFDQCHLLLQQYQHSTIFKFTINEEIQHLEEIRYKINGLDFHLETKKVQYFHNQLLKLKWITKFNTEFQDKFENENLLGGISSDVGKKCADFINQKIHGSIDAKTAIDYWTKNKNWLFNQVQIIKQANSTANTEKKSFWQKGLSKMKSWFGR